MSGKPMSERPTDEELRRLLTKYGFQSDSSTVLAILDEKDALRARVAKLEAALKDICKQMLMSEMGAEQAEYADYEGAYETMIKVARAALSETVEA